MRIFILMWVVAVGAGCTVAPSEGKNSGFVGKIGQAYDQLWQTDDGYVDVSTLQTQTRDVPLQETALIPVPEMPVAAMPAAAPAGMPVSQAPDPDPDAEQSRPFALPDDTQIKQSDTQ